MVTLAFQLVLGKHKNFYQHSRELKENAPSIAQLSLQMVREMVLEQYKDKVLSIITDIFEKERNYENTEKEKVKSLVDIIENCGLAELSDITAANFRSKTI